MKLASLLLSLTTGGALLAASPVTSFAPPSSIISTKLSLWSRSLPMSTTEAASTTTTTSTAPTMPTHSPATSLPNQIYKWRGYDIRYQVTGPPNADHTLLLIHGLFVNSDHWRKTLTGLHPLNDDLHNNDNNNNNTADEKQKKKSTIRIYAIDLLGSGWSSKPSKTDPMAQAVSGENGRFTNCNSTCYREANANNTNNQQLLKKRPTKIRSSSILQNAPLGTASGGNRLASSLELRHPLNSPYNFYTWAEQIADFIHDVIHSNHHGHDDGVSSASSPPKVTLIANSIGTISSLQSILDEPQLFNGCFIINPNFRELHMAEIPFSPLTMPLVRTVQSTLRNNGHGLFASLAKPHIVKEILKEPYAVVDAVDDELVQVLLDPLLTPGADDVVFDTLSYSAGPLPEQQLSSRYYPKETCPTWVVYGEDDPWTPKKRVESLTKVGTRGESSTVERIVGLEGVGHCPHDESPEVVNKLILEFLDRLSG
eukprot:scaffold26645_cov150-Skeletonema_menzelii.AAC.9